MRNEVELFPYQRDGRDFLAGKSHALLADTMGLGKSGQAIAACDRVGARSILVICPAAVRFNWDREFDRFSSQGLPSKIILSGKDEPAPLGITICSYDLATTETIHKKLMARGWDVLILDEMHFCKSRTAKRTKAIFGPKLNGTGGLAGQAKHVWGLTGTPAPNNPSDLYPMMRAFGLWDKGYWPFVETYCTGYEGGFGYKITGARNVPALKKKLSTIILRRRTEEVLKDLPPISYSDLVLDPADCNQDYLKEMLEAEKSPEGAALSQLLNGDTNIETLDLSALKMATLRRITGMAKVEAMAKLINYELTEGGVGKVVIFAVHRDPLKRLRDSLRKHSAMLIFGGMDAEKKQQKIDAFKSNYKHRVFIANIAAAGTGIDGLQHATNNVLFMESSWSPAENAQAAHRVHRIGQQRPVNVRFVSLANSLDEHVTRVIRRKTAMVSQLFD